jgi:hypothetical protein
MPTDVASVKVHVSSRSLTADMLRYCQIVDALYLGHVAGIPRTPRGHFLVRGYARGNASLVWQ